MNLAEWLGEKYKGKQSGKNKTFSSLNEWQLVQN